MSGPWDAKFTDEQKEAVAIARVDGGRTARRVAEMAAAGELTLRGEPVGAFNISDRYVNEIGKRLERDRTGKTASKVAELPHRDAVENLRLRLIAGADAMLTAWEKQAAKSPEKADTERHRQIVRCVLEASRLPGPGDKRPAPDTSKDQQGKSAPRTVGGPAGALLKEHRRTAPAQEAHTHSTQDGEQGAAQRSAPRSNEQQHGETGTRTLVASQA